VESRGVFHTRVNYESRRRRRRRRRRESERFATLRTARERRGSERLRKQPYVSLSLSLSRCCCLICVASPARDVAIDNRRDASPSLPARLRPRDFCAIIYLGAARRGYVGVETSPR